MFGDVRARTYQTYAASHAGARPGGKGAEYFDDLGFYASQQQHNQFAVVDDGPGAVLYPDVPDAAWAWADQDLPSMTLQTCLGARSEYRLIVRLVEVS